LFGLDYTAEIKASFVVSGLKNHLPKKPISLATRPSLIMTQAGKPVSPSEWNLVKANRSGGMRGAFPSYMFLMLSGFF
jgi:hypothetical protein